MDGSRFFLKQATKVVDYLAVRFACILFVFLRVGNLEVIVYQIDIGKYPTFKDLEVKISAGFQNKVDMPGLQAFQKRLEIAGI
jgi:hypothetical protein